MQGTVPHPSPAPPLGDQGRGGGRPPGGEQGQEGRHPEGHEEHRRRRGPLAHSPGLHHDDRAQARDVKHKSGRACDISPYS